jgi:hypothetical protein
VDPATEAESDFYSRMLPARERPVEALGGVLAGIGAGFGICAIFALPIFLGAIGIALSGSSLAMARSRQATQRFGLLFTIAVVGWFIGMCYATWQGKDLWP